MARQHTVEKGECMATIAKRFGFLNWKTIYDDPKNASFREDNPDPTCIQPGSSLYIPDKKRETVKAAGRPKVTFVAKKPELYFTVMLIDHQNRPLSDIPYTLTIGEQQYSGNTVGGYIEHAITVDDKEGELSIRPYEEFPDWIVACKFQLGHLDTAESVAGHQQRSHHKRNYTGPPDGNADSATKAAICRLQIANNMAPDGSATPKTAALLRV